MSEPVIVETQFTRRVKIVPLQCIQCGGEFEGPAYRKYCSLKCQRRRSYENYRDRHGVPSPGTTTSLRDWGARE